MRSLALRLLPPPSPTYPALPVPLLPLRPPESYKRLNSVGLLSKQCNLSYRIDLQKNRNAHKPSLPASCIAPGMDGT